MFLFAGGIVVYSKDKLLKVETAQPVTQTEKKFFIDLNGKLIELMDKSEVRKARREGYTVVEK